jgi:hypothetical protein
MIKSGIVYAISANECKIAHKVVPTLLKYDCLTSLDLNIE